MGVRESWASSEATRRSMRGNRSRDTKPELALRRLLFARGLRYRVAYRPLASARRLTVDIAFPGARIAVLLDGCFWHGCAAHYREPKSHTDYWQAKIARNQERDAASTAWLEAEGWTVMRFWEHEDYGRIADIVEAAVRATSRGPRRPTRRRL